MGGGEWNWCECLCQCVLRQHTLSYTTVNDAMSQSHKLAFTFFLETKHFSLKKFICTILLTPTAVGSIFHPVRDVHGPCCVPVRHQECYYCGEKDSRHIIRACHHPPLTAHAQTHRNNEEIIYIHFE